MKKYPKLYKKKPFIRRCSVANCNKKHFGKSFCVMHYERNRKGTPMDAPPRNTPFLEKFLARISKRKSSKDCWVYDGPIYQSGYGALYVNGKPYLAHRFSYEYHKGVKLDSGLHVLHSCDNPPCCNPDHLHLGTHQDNMAEMMKRNRQARGVKNHCSKLTDAIVRKIKIALSNGEKGKDLAVKYKVYSSAISKIKLGRTWKHVTISEEL